MLTLKYPCTFSSKGGQLTRRYGFAPNYICCVMPIEKSSNSNLSRKLNGTQNDKI